MGWPSSRITSSTVRSPPARSPALLPDFAVGDDRWRLWADDREPAFGSSAKWQRYTMSVRWPGFFSSFSPFDWTPPLQRPICPGHSGMRCQGRARMCFIGHCACFETRPGRAGSLLSMRALSKIPHPEVLREARPRRTQALIQSCDILLSLCRATLRNCSDTHAKSTTSIV